MKRGLIIKLVVFLLLGAVVNVVVAWGCAIWSYPRFTFPELDLDKEIMEAAGIATGNARHQVEPSFGRVNWWIWSGRQTVGQWIRCGWPMYGFEGGYAEDPEIGYWREIGAIDVSTATHRRLELTQSLIPLRPIFSGFLINTAFYGLILWLLWSAPFATRRLIRKRRGRCLKCGYDLRHAEHEVCPECGGER